MVDWISIESNLPHIDPANGTSDLHLLWVVDGDDENNGYIVIGYYDTAAPEGWFYPIDDVVATAFEACEVSNAVSGRVTHYAEMPEGPKVSE